MKIGDKVKVGFGEQLRNDGFGKMTTEQAKRAGYLFIGREGVIVSVKDGDFRTTYGVHLDDDHRDDGSPDIRWFELDAPGSLAQVIELVQADVILDETAQAIYATNRESINGDIRRHNAEIQSELDQLNAELAEIKTDSNYWSNDDKRERASALYVRIGNLKRSFVKEGEKPYIPPELNDVMTPGEAVEVYGLAEATVRQAINRGQIFARKSGGTWLIRRADAEAKWGKK